MDQKRIGQFIAQVRKEKGLTQAELGGLLGVTNKTVSRWETGNYMPDLSLLQSLCKELEIGVNELLSGERLSVENYHEKAEKNIVYVLEREEQIKKEIRISNFLSGSGTGMLIGIVYAPDSIRKTICLIVSVAMIIVGWSIKSKLNKKIISGK